MEKEAEKYCGNCCWFYAEDTDGYGLCPLALMESKRCDEPCTNGKFISRQEMRHHMAVLLQQSRYQKWFDEGFDGVVYPPTRIASKEARVFAYKYIKTFSKL